MAVRRFLRSERRIASEPARLPSQIRPTVLSDEGLQ